MRYPKEVSKILYTDLLYVPTHMQIKMRQQTNLRNVLLSLCLLNEVNFVQYNHHFVAGNLANHQTLQRKFTRKYTSEENLKSTQLLYGKITPFITEARWYHRSSIYRARTFSNSVETLNFASHKHSN